MSCKKHVVGFLAAGGLSVVLPLAHATDRAFNNNSGNNWSTAANWTGSTVPSFSDKVTIPSGETCNVDISNAQADHLVVESTAVLNIQAGSAGGGNNRQLSIDSSDDPVSDIDGTINLQGQYSSFVMSGSTTLSGDGEVIGAHDAATMDFSNAAGLVSRITLEGNLQIVGSGFNTDLFTNEGVINANHDGVFLIQDCAIEDDGSAIWKTSSTFIGSPTLRLNHLPPHSQAGPKLDGEFQINVGTLDILTPIFVFGKLKQYGGTITTDGDANAVFSFDDNDNTSCP